MSHAQSFNISHVFVRTEKILAAKFANLTLGVLAIIALIIAFSALSRGAFYAALFLPFVANYVWAFNISARVFTFLLYLVLGVLAQIILIDVLLKNYSTFKDNLLAAKKYFWQMLILNIVIGAIFILAGAPFYASAIFFIMNNPILAYTSIIVGIILTILSAVFLLFSPFILIEENKNWLDSIKQSGKLAKDNILIIIFDLLILTFIFVFLNFFSMLLTEQSLAYLIFGAILSLFLIMFSFCYLTAMYLTFTNK